MNEKRLKIKLYYTVLDDIYGGRYTPDDRYNPDMIIDKREIYVYLPTGWTEYGKNDAGEILYTDGQGHVGIDFCKNARGNICIIAHGKNGDKLIPCKKA